MAINSNWQIINDVIRVATMEGIAQDIDKFNAASNGLMRLVASPLEGDNETSVFDKLIPNLIGERTPYTDSNVTPLDLTTANRSRVKVHRQLRPVNIDPQHFTIMLNNPMEGATRVGQMAGPLMLQDMLNTAIGALVAAMVQTSAITVDGVTGLTVKTMTQAKFNQAQKPFGDRYSDIVGWMMHSKPFLDLYGDHLDNSSRLFTAGDVSVLRDLIGRPIIVTDSPQLMNTTPNPDQYRVLGLTAGAIEVQNNADIFSNIELRNGQTNIKATIQSEYSFNLEIKGYSWDITNGGRAPTNSALFTSANWDKWVESDKNGPGVILNVE